MFLIDRNAETRDSLAQILDHAGFEVLALSGEASAETLLDLGTVPQAILLDVGHDHGPAGRFLDLQQQRRIPVVVMSACAGLATRGIVLRKPFPPDELLALLRDPILLATPTRTASLRICSGFQLEVALNVVEKGVVLEDPCFGTIDVGDTPCTRICFGSARPFKAGVMAAERALRALGYEVSVGMAG